MYLSTPVLRLRKGKETLKFFGETEYEQWKHKTGTEYKSWEHDYYKGLGSSTASDIKEDFQAPRIVTCLYDDSSPAAFKLAFDKKLTNLRKEWINQHKPLVDVLDIKMQPISKFLFHQLADYAVSNVARSIPRLMDGLKESQRKILWGTLLHWGTKKGGQKWSKKILNGAVRKFKTAQLGAEVAKYAYKHGETILYDTIKGMAHEYPGTNNLPYFTKEGMLGTRGDGGKDSANARYTFVKPNWWLPLVFKNEDFPQMTMVIDEGEPQEPVAFLPIIPLPVINGCDGIATGWSTYAPSHNPETVCQWLKARINGEQLPEVIPWFRDFTGDVRVIVRQPGDDRSEAGDDQSSQVDPTDVANIGDVASISDVQDADAQDVDKIDVLGPDHLDTETQCDIVGAGPNLMELTSREEPVLPARSRITLITSGVFRVVGNKVIITELPIGRWTSNYDIWLKGLIKEGIIKDVNTQCGPNTVYFEVIGMKKPTLKNLRLQKSFGMNNMVMLDLKNRPKRFTDVQEVLEDFYQLRLPYYDARKANILNVIQTQIDKLTYKMQFIMLVLEGRIIVIEPGSKRRSRKKVEILTQMQTYGIPSFIYDEVHLSHLSEEDVASLQVKIDNLIVERSTVENTPPAQMWVNDIDEFMEAYDHYYTNVYEAPELVQDTLDGSTATTKKRGTGRKAAGRGKGKGRGRGTGKGKK